jgi:hypothetical protein
MGRFGYVAQAPGVRREIRESGVVFGRLRTCMILPDFMALPTLFRDRADPGAHKPGGARSRTPRAAAVCRTAGASLAVVAALSAGGPAEACPSCPVGRQARSEVWNCDFEQNLFYALLPFLVIGAVCLGVERIGRKPAPLESATELDGIGTIVEPRSEPLT